MFPPEVITFIVTFVLRTLADKWMQAGEDRRMEKAMDKDMAEMEVQAQHSVRGHIPKMLFGLTTSLLAIIAFVCIIGVRIVAPLFFDVPVYFAFNEQSAGFMFFVDSVSRVQYMELPGITFLPSDSHLISAIAGAFFGKVRK